MIESDTVTNVHVLHPATLHSATLIIQTLYQDNDIRSIDAKRLQGIGEELIHLRYPR